MTVILILFASLLLGCNQEQPSLTPKPPEGAQVNYPAGRVIGGEKVPADSPDYKSIVRIVTNSTVCTASIVGPRVILTAAHCARTGATSKFKVAGKTYSAKITRSSLYPFRDHDMALGLVTEEVKDIAYEQIANFKGKPLKTGQEVMLYGYGCTAPGGGGGNDGILRKGASRIKSFSRWDFVTKKPQGAALCFGDSGGPTFAVEGQKRYQIGVNSKGNISDTSYLVNLSLDESQKFFADFAASNKVDICGVTKDCGVTPPPAPEVVVVESKLGKLQMEIAPETLDKDYVKRHLEMLMDFFVSMFDESGEMKDGEIKTLPQPLEPGKDPFED